MRTMTETNMKRVLLVHERFPPDFAGGGEYVALKTAQTLKKKGIHVKVLTTGNPQITEYEGIKTRRLPISRYRFNFAWKEVIRDARDVDIIHSFTYHGILPAFIAARRLQKPIVCEVLALFDDAWYEMKGRRLGMVFRAFERFLMWLPSNAKIYQSDFSRSLAQKLHLDRKNDYVIEPGISLEDYRVDSEKSYVLFSGKLDVRKGIDYVLESAGQLPDIPFMILGWGPYCHKIKERLPPNVVLNIVESDESSATSDYHLQVADLTAKARIFVFPTRAETFGLVVVEAMASGCAIVSTSELPFEGRRVVFGDQKGLTEAIRSLWNDPAACAEFGEKNHKIAQNFNWERHVRSLLKVYGEIISSNPV